MNSKFKITATIVLYNQNIEILKKTIKSFLSIPEKKKLFIVDNSPQNTLENHFSAPEIEYIFVGKNVGFGRGHNVVIPKISKISQFHLVLNPDVEFNKSVISQLIFSLENNKNVAMASPRVVYQNSAYQYTCRKYPTIFDLINRRIKLFPNQVFKNQYQYLDLEKPFHPDFIHGCFMLFKTNDFIQLKGFDERYFLYMEDVDICKMIDKLGKKKLYYPNVEIVHQHQKGSSKNLKLLYYHLTSAIKYFLKWGF